MLMLSSRVNCAWTTVEKRVNKKRKNFRSEQSLRLSDHAENMLIFRVLYKGTSTLPCAKRWRENQRKKIYIKTHVNLLHVWRGGGYEIMSAHPMCAWYTVTGQRLTVMTAVLCQSRRGKHVSCGNTVLTDTASVVVESHILMREKSGIIKNLRVHRM